MRQKRNKETKRAQISFLDELIIDNFAGGGGASTGIELATGRPVNYAINHSHDAILMHKTNHPFCCHLQTSVWDIEPLELTNGGTQPVGIAWFSPDCTHFSKARGGKPVDKNIRSLSWIVVKWGLLVRPKLMLMENVEEIQTWGPLIETEDGLQPDPDRSGETFDAFVKVLSTGIEPTHPAIDEICEYLNLKRDDDKIQQIVNGLGYKVEYRELVAADYGAPTTRKRFVLIARCDGEPIVWPKRTHAPRNSEDVKSGKLPAWKSAASIIDWSDLGYSIFESKEEIKAKYGVKVRRPLKPNTLRRIIRGVDKFTIKNGEPFLIECNHSGDGHIMRVEEPVNTVTGKYTGGIVNPMLAPITITNTTGSAASPVDEPTHTITSAGNQMLAGAQLISIGQTGGGDRIRSIEDPVPTTVSKQETCLVAANLMQYHTEVGNVYCRGNELSNPLGTIDGANRHGLVSAHLTEYFGNGNPLSVKNPLHTVTSKDREAIISAHLTEMRGMSIGTDVNDPAPTVTGCIHEGLVSAHIQKFFGGVVGEDVRNPLPTVTSVDHNALASAHIVKFKGQEIGTNANDPLHTTCAGGLEHAVCSAVITKVKDANIGYWPQIRSLLNEYCDYKLKDDEVVLLIINNQQYVITDLFLRMLKPRELYSANGFPRDYRIDRDYMGNVYPKSKQVERCGNAVCPPLAEAIVRANRPDLAPENRITTLEDLENIVAM